MNAREQRIVATAIDLAERGGFEAVRLRDVASHANVALGTLYRYFRSKEDLLIAALTLEVEQLEKRMQSRPLTGDNTSERLSAFFRAGTKGMCRRPRLARAILRAVASGDYELAEKVSAFHTRMTAMISSALRADAAADNGGSKGGSPATQSEDTIALILEEICSPCWSAGRAVFVDRPR